MLPAVSVSEIQQLRRNECGYATLTWSIRPPNESKGWLAHSNDSHDILFEIFFVRFSLVIVNVMTNLIRKIVSSYVDYDGILAVIEPF